MALCLTVADRPQPEVETRPAKRTVNGDLDPRRRSGPAAAGVLPCRLIILLNVHPRPHSRIRALSAEITSAGISNATVRQVPRRVFERPLSQQLCPRSRAGRRLAAGLQRSTTARLAEADSKWISVPVRYLSDRSRSAVLNASLNWSMSLRSFSSSIRSLSRSSSLMLSRPSQLSTDVHLGCWSDVVLARHFLNKLHWGVNGRRTPSALTIRQDTHDSSD